MFEGNIWIVWFLWELPMVTSRAFAFLSISAIYCSFFSLDFCAEARFEMILKKPSNIRMKMLDIIRYLKLLLYIWTTYSHYVIYWPNPLVGKTLTWNRDSTILLFLTNYDMSRVITFSHDILWLARDSKTMLSVFHINFSALKEVELGPTLIEYT